jgi:hypothetical protein
MHVVNKNPTKYIVYLTIMQYNYDNIQENMMKQKAETKKMCGGYIWVWLYVINKQQRFYSLSKRYTNPDEKPFLETSNLFR